MDKNAKIARVITIIRKQAKHIACVEGKHGAALTETAPELCQLLTELVNEFGPMHDVDPEVLAKANEPK